MSDGARKIVWIAGRRGEILRLGPLFRAVAGDQRGLDPRPHTFLFTGEQGMGAYQALDSLGLRPDEEHELRGAEDPAIRLHCVLHDVETHLRQKRATHVVFTGCGATAMACALACLGRQLRWLWLRPNDAAGLIQRFPVEAGYAAAIGALPDSVSVINLPAPEAVSVPPADRPGANTASESEPPAHPSASAKDSRARVVVSIGRDGWVGQYPHHVFFRALESWCRELPEVDFVVMRSLHSSQEGELRRLDPAPANLQLQPPLPPAEFLPLLSRASVVVTDSHWLAEEARVMGAAVIGFVEKRIGDATGDRSVRYGTPEDFSRDTQLEELKKLLSEAGPVRSAPEITVSPSLADSIHAWLADQ